MKTAVAQETPTGRAIAAVMADSRRISGMKRQ
jgi:hypothetical protein